MLDKNKLIWGTKCRHHVTNADGHCLRHKSPSGHEGGCVACYRKAPNDIDQDLLYIQVTTRKAPSRTPEEKAAGACEASKRWNKKNKDKVAVYQKTYQSKPGVREANNIKTLARYHNISEEDKMELNRKKYADQKVRSGIVSYKERMAGMTPEQLKEREEQKRLDRNEYSRTKYAKLDAAQRLHLKDKHKEYRENVKARKDVEKDSD